MNSLNQRETTQVERELENFASFSYDDKPTPEQNFINCFEEISRMGDLLSFVEINPEMVKKLLASEDTEHGKELLLNAACDGHIEVLKHLEQLNPAAAQILINNIYIPNFQEIVLNGHLDVIRFLFERVRNNTSNEWNKIGDNLFYSLAFNGHLEVLAFLLEQEKPDCTQTLIDNLYILYFQKIAQNGHLEVLKFLFASVRPKISKESNKIDENLFYSVAYSGHIEVLKFLFEKALSVGENWIQSINAELFSELSLRGHIEVLTFLIEKAASVGENWIQSINAELFSQLSLRGHIEVLTFLFKKAASVGENWIQSINAELFSQLAFRRSTKGLKFLYEKAPDKVTQWIDTQNDSLFQNFLKDRNIDILAFILQKKTESLEKFISEDVFKDLLDLQEDLDSLKLYFQHASNENIELMIQLPEFGHFIQSFIDINQQYNSPKEDAKSFFDFKRLLERQNTPKALEYANALGQVPCIQKLVELRKLMLRNTIFKATSYGLLGAGATILAFNPTWVLVGQLSAIHPAIAIGVFAAIAAIFLGLAAHTLYQHFKTSEH